MNVQKFDRKPGQSDDMFKRYYGPEEELTLKVGSKYIISRNDSKKNNIKLYVECIDVIKHKNIIYYKLQMIELKVVLSDENKKQKVSEKDFFQKGKLILYVNDFGFVKDDYTPHIKKITLADILGNPKHTVPMTYNVEEIS